MSQIERVAELLRKAIADRQVLMIGESDAAVTVGNSGLFQTGTRIISAIATNFCYGKCLLAKIDNQWYAVNPIDNRSIIRKSIDRMEQSKAKLSTSDTFPSKFVGVNDFGDPRKLIYDFDVNLTELGAVSLPPIEPSFATVYLDNLSGDDETTLDREYWRIVGFRDDSPFIFFSIDSTNELIRYIVPSNQVPNNSIVKYIGGSKVFTRVSQNGGVASLPNPYNNLSKMRFYTPTGIQTGSAALVDYSLEQPTVSQLWGYANPVPPIGEAPRITLDDYYYDASVARLELGNSPNGLDLGGGLTGIFTVSYPVLSRATNSKLPLLVGQKTLSRIITLDPLPIESIGERVYSNWNPGSQTGTLQSFRSYSVLVYNNSELISEDITLLGLSTITYDLDSLSINLNALTDYSFLSPGNYTLSGNTITFLSGLGSYSQERIRSTLSVNNIVTETTYETNPIYTSHQNVKVAIVTDRIQNCQYTSIQTEETLSSAFPDLRRYKTISATYAELIPDTPNSTSLRGLFFISAILFDPEYTTIVNSPDCYAKFYRTFAQDNQLFTLEFWVLEDGNVHLSAIHDRETLPGEIIFDNRSCVYYPGLIEE